MKKLIISMLVVASCFGVTNAQLMVDENGHIGLNIETNDTIKSDVGINTLGSTGIAVSMVQDAEKARNRFSSVQMEQLNRLFVGVS